MNNIIEVSSYDEMMLKLGPFVKYKTQLKNFRVLVTCIFCGLKYETSALSVYERHKLNKIDFECSSCRGKRCIKFAQAQKITSDKRSSISKKNVANTKSCDG